MSTPMLVNTYLATIKVGVPCSRKYAITGLSSVAPLWMTTRVYTASNILSIRMVVMAKNKFWW